MRGLIALALVRFLINAYNISDSEKIENVFVPVLLTIFAVFLVVITFPISLFMCIKVYMCKSICASRTVKIIGFEHRWLKNTRGRLSSGLAGSRKEAPKAQVIYSRKGAILLLEAGVTRRPYMFVPSI